MLLTCVRRLIGSPRNPGNDPLAAGEPDSSRVLTRFFRVSCFRPSVRVVSVNSGPARSVPWKGMAVRTGIYKIPVADRVRVCRDGFDGDEQADPSAHGGADKAVYAYPSEHYGFWSRELARQDLTWGAFGENLTTEGLLESSVRVGDRFRVGTSILEVTKPRFPCYKLGIKFGREDIIPRFLHSGRSGFYLAVVAEGDVGPGDTIAFIPRAPSGRSIEEVVRERAEADEGE